MWGQRADASVYTFTTSDKKVLDNFRALLKKNLTDHELLEAMNSDSASVLSIDRRKYEKGDNSMVDASKWEKGNISEAVSDGKTTIVRHLLKKFSNLEFSISACSRPKRNLEIDGKDYYFLSVDEFKKRIFTKQRFVYWGWF